MLFYPFQFLCDAIAPSGTPIPGLSPKILVTRFVSLMIFGGLSVLLGDDNGAPNLKRVYAFSFPLVTSSGDPMGWSMALRSPSFVLCIDAGPG
jgi:hypothetical protein